MTAQVQQISYFGETALQAANSYFEAVLVPGWGSTLISLVVKEKQVELLRVPKSAEDYLIKPALYGTPILFPPNRISEGRFSFGERTYQFEVNEPAKNNHIHGFVYKEKWDLVRTEASGERVVIETEFDSSKFPDVMKQFPHHFVIRMTFTIDGATVHKDATIINKSNEAFPWGIGYHTTFRFPFRPGDALGKCKFALTADRKWQLNERNLPTGELIEIADADKWRSGISLVGHQLDDVFLSSVVSGGGNEARLMDDNIGLEVRYTADENFTQWVIFNSDGQQGFLCPEPYTWVTNAPNLDLPASITGLQVIQPGQTHTARTQITASGY